jgi:1-acyl-sn-glycerol-3-phosphate acyltransferase
MRSSAALAVRRAARTGGHALEVVGQARTETWGRGPESRRRVQATRLRRLCVELCRLHGFEVRVHGRLPAGPAVMVSNHASYIDAPVLAALAPVAPVAKSEIETWPLFGVAARQLGIVFVRRGDAHSGARALRGALRALASGVSVLGFPEGTTTLGDQLLPFRRGLFGVARIAKVPVVPVAISYPSPALHWVGEAWFLSHYLRTAMRPHTVVDVHIGQAIFPDATSSAEELARLARAAIRALIGRSCP